MDNADVLSVFAERCRDRGVAADRLTYTDEFERLFGEVLRRTGATLTRSEFWRMLVGARKRGRLPRLTR